MTEAAVLQAMREHCEGLFPNECGACHRRFLTLQEYVKATRPVRSRSTAFRQYRLGAWR